MLLCLQSEGRLYVHPPHIHKYRSPHIKQTLIEQGFKLALYDINEPCDINGIIKIGETLDTSSKNFSFSLLAICPARQLRTEFVSVVIVIVMALHSFISSIIPSYFLSSFPKRYVLSLPFLFSFYKESKESKKKKRILI